MEGLLNYSSEDDQDESNYKNVAERGYRVARKRRSSSSDSGRGDHYKESETKTTMRTEGKDRNYQKYEDNNDRYSKNGSNSKNGNRYGHSSSYRDGYSDTKEARDAKNGRDYRDNGQSAKYDSRMGDRNREKDYRNERERDSNRRRDRDDDRDYNNRRQPVYSNNRYYKDNRPQRYNEPSSHRQQHYSRQEKSQRISKLDRSSERYRRKGGSSRSRSRSRSGSRNHSNSPGRHHNTKRSDKYKKHGSRTPSRSRSRSRSTRSRSPRDHGISNQAIDTEKRSKHLSEPRKSSPKSNNGKETIAPLMSLPMSAPAMKSVHLNTVPHLMGVPTTNISTIKTSANTEIPAIQVPSYYNASVINPIKYAEQVQKRKLLWGAKKTEDTAAKWGSAHFSEDSDGKVASKFMRLMGIKSTKSADGSTEGDNSTSVEKPDVKSREEMFSTMEHQYEAARQTTHTMRGVGLGFGSQARPF